MVPNGAAYDNYPSFANNGTKTPPGGSTESAKYALGMVPADTFPAEWANYLFHGATAGITRLNSDTGSIKKEINTVLSNFNITPDATLNNQLMEALTKLKAEAALAAHPVGSLYWTASTENPATTFGGGTWTQIKDKFILAAGDTYANGATGGAATVTLTIQQIPSHTHKVTASGSIENATATGTISVKINPTFAGTAVTSGGASTETVSITDPKHSHPYNTGYTSNNEEMTSGSFVQVGLQHRHDTANLSSITTKSATGITAKHPHTHSVTASGTISGGAYTFKGTDHNHTFTGSEVTSVATGGGQAHNNMPPYVVKYCWERTA